jgi:multicomponent Na+:H+ antiporter subunit C
MIQITALILFMIGLVGLLIERHVIKLIVSLNILEIGLNIFIITIGYNEGMAPIVSSLDEGALLYVDPLPQALVLTSIVIGVGTTALALAFAKMIHHKYQTFDLTELEGLE